MTALMAYPVVNRGIKILSWDVIFTRQGHTDTVNINKPNAMWETRQGLYEYWIVNVNNPISMASWQCAMNVVKNLRPMTSSAVTSYWRLILLQATTALHWIVKQTNKQQAEQTKQNYKGQFARIGYLLSRDPPLSLGTFRKFFVGRI